ncbi:hypothetical protein GCM10007863_05730 [Dyella mobilis]|nr:hypothetical protein GCM10007863_05730 [Dyella mobilis]
MVRRNPPERPANSAKTRARHAKYSMGFHTIEIATRLDTRDKSLHGADSVMAAFPYAGDAADVIESAKEACEADQWGACRAIHARTGSH